MQLKIEFTIPELGTASNQQIAALVGVAPFCNDSGKRSKKRYIKGGRKQVRNMLYMAATSMIRYNTKLKTFYNKLTKDKQKPHKVAVTAVIRKIIVIINNMVKNNQKWKLDEINAT